MKYRIDPSRISFEHIQDETIVIDFETGAYFSIGGIGCDIWEKIVEGLDTSAILQSARSTFDAADSEVEEGILHFLEALEREELIAGTGESARSDPGTISDSLPWIATCAAPTTTAVLPNALESFTRRRRPPMLVRTIMRTV